MQCIFSHRPFPIRFATKISVKNEWEKNVRPPTVSAWHLHRSQLLHKIYGIVILLTTKYHECMSMMISMLNAFISFGNHLIISCFHIIWITCNTSIKTVKSEFEMCARGGSILDKMSVVLMWATTLRRCYDIIPHYSVKLELIRKYHGAVYQWVNITVKNYIFTCVTSIFFTKTKNHCLNISSVNSTN